MPRHIRLNAFSMNCVTHQSTGLWRHPRDRSTSYNTLAYWTELAALLERGKFDGIFIADVLGVYDVFGGSADAALRTGAQVPVNDPLLLVSAMATVTRHLGFGITSNVSTEPPFAFARRMSTLDHLTGGRIGWNIVTGYLDSAAKAAGAKKQVAHDIRYDIADEYMEIVYRLWEESWEDGAAVRDSHTGVYADPSKVHRIDHTGTYFRVDGIHLSEPSPQRTPVLYQAGASAKGQTFAARHAECVFVSAAAKHVVASMVAGIRKHVAAQGRRPESVLVFTMITVVVAETDVAAQALHDEYRAYADREAALVMVSGATGIDFSRFTHDQIVTHVETDSMRTAIDRLTVADPNRTWTVGEVADFAAIGGSSPIIVGSPQRIADELEGWMDETGIDGFNLTYTVAPECFVDFVRLVVPELQRRGRYKDDYEPGTLRDKLFGAGPRLSAPHVGASYRRDNGDRR